MHLSTVTFPDPLNPVMMTSSGSRLTCRGALLVGIRIVDSGFDQVVVAVAPAEEHRESVGFRVAVDKVVAILFHLEDGLVQGHWLPARVLVDAENALLC